MNFGNSNILPILSYFTCRPSVPTSKLFQETLVATTNRRKGKRNLSTQEVQKGTHRIYMRNLMKGKPSKYLLPESLPHINQYIAVLSTILAVVNQQRSIAPEIHSPSFQTKQQLLYEIGRSCSFYKFSYIINFIECIH